MHIISTPHAPQAIWPYSQAIVTTGLIFCSGQIGLDPQTGELVAGGIQEQTQQIFCNIDAVLEQAKSHRSRIIKTTIFLTDLNDFARVNERYADYLGSHRPARSTVQVSALPRWAMIEIECIVSC